MLAAGAFRAYRSGDETLMQWIAAQVGLRERDHLIPTPFPFEAGQTAAEVGGKSGFEGAPRLDQPILEQSGKLEPLEQLAASQKRADRDELRRVSVLQEPAELSDVANEYAWTDRDPLTVDVQQSLREITERRLQFEQALAQARPGLLLGPITPEQAAKTVAQDARVPLQANHGQDRACTTAGDGNRCAVGGEQP